MSRKISFSDTISRLSASLEEKAAAAREAVMAGTREAGALGAAGGASGGSGQQAGGRLGSRRRWVERPVTVPPADKELPDLPPPTPGDYMVRMRYHYAADLARFEDATVPVPYNVTTEQFVARIHAQRCALRLVCGISKHQLRVEMDRTSFVWKLATLHADSWQDQLPMRRDVRGLTDGELREALFVMRVRGGRDFVRVFFRVDGVHETGKDIGRDKKVEIRNSVPQTAGLIPPQLVAVKTTERRYKRSGTF